MFEFKNFPRFLAYIEKEIDNDHYLSYLKEGKWETISSSEFTQKVHQLANAFFKAGVKQGDCVAIISDSSPFWLMVDFALQELGAISVPIFANIASENLIYEIEDANISYMFIASQEKFDQLKDLILQMKLVITLEVDDHAENVISFFDFIKGCRSENEFSVAVDPDDIATIIYTSGSTGRPKGVELTHDNFISQLRDVQEVLPLHDHHIALSFLPLAHIFERMVMSYYLATNVSIYFADDVKNVGNLIKEVKPTLMTVVPRLLDKISTKMHENAASAKGIKWLIAKMAFHAADTKPVGLPPSIIDRLSAKLVYKKLLEALGGNLELLICGGAPLSQKTEQFFTNIGLDLYQGYGLSESSPVISVNTPSDHKFGTTGKVLPSQEIKISEDGELLVRGPNVMKAYHNQPEKTAKTIEDGWLHTGDLAEIDKEGYLTIKSRKKELFKTSTGKYVAAIPLEQAMSQSKWIDYAVVVADNRPFVTALIFIDPINLDAFAQEKNIQDRHFESLVGDESFVEGISRIIHQINRHQNAWEKVRKFKLVAELPTIENQILTPSMKISRQKAYDRYAEDIEKMYEKPYTKSGGEL